MSRTIGPDVDAPRSRGGKVLTAIALLLPLSLGLAGCISSSNPSPPANTTIVVPNGSNAVCTDGTAPPCR
jgi:hypothetical protein